MHPVLEMPAPQLVTARKVFPNIGAALAAFEVAAGVGGPKPLVGGPKPLEGFWWSVGTGAGR